jgi:uncharacterized protein YbjT (DUF2867 family)
VTEGVRRHGVERNSGISHWESKWEIEQHIRKFNLPATILWPAGFMENYYVVQVEIGILKGKLMDPVRAGKTVSDDCRRRHWRLRSVRLRAAEGIYRRGS